MKITAKTSKEALKKFLGDNVLAVKEQDKDLFDRIAYASKMCKEDDSKVTRKDLVDLTKEVMKVLGDTVKEPTAPQETPAPAETPVETPQDKAPAPTPATDEQGGLALDKPEAPAKVEKPKAENSVKLKGKKKEENPEQDKAPAPPAEPENKVDEKKSAKKSLGKKKEPKKDDVTASKKGTVQTKAYVLAEVFPETFELDGQKYEIARDIANMGQLHDAVEENNESIVFAMYWTPRHIKQFGYGVNTLKAPKEFPMDLDLATCVYVSESNTVVYAISTYTEVCYMYLPNDIEESDGLRYAGGVEYQIYRVV